LLSLFAILLSFATTQLDYTKLSSSDVGANFDAWLLQLGRTYSITIKTQKL